MSNRQEMTGNLAISEQQQRVIVIEATEKPQDLKLRVAAYTRVSSDSADQLNSFAAQNRYYTALISGKENWTMVDIYADRGITGTSVEKREDFQRLMADCRRGLIDKILCKSISRFARNTTECLAAIRELKVLGIGIEFEEQHINTAKLSGEMLTAIFASIAQEESESISSHVRRGIQMRMEMGTFMPATLPYGYRKVNGEITIHHSEAQVVRQIFAEYLSGHNTREISEKMNQLSPSNSSRLWTYKSIARILRNEKYTGNSIWQKSYRTDELPRKERRNHGERNRYFAAGTHPAIITQNEFDRVQQLLAQRKETCFKGREICASMPAGIIYCGCCGSHTRKKKINGKRYHICRTHDVNSHSCPVGAVPETQIHAAFLRLYCKLKHQGSGVLPQMLATLRTVRNQRMLWSEDIIELNKRISNITSQNQLLAMLKQQGGVDPDIFISRSNELAEQLRAVKLEKERLLNARRDDTITQTQALIDAIEAGPDFLEKFDGELFGELVDRIIVENNERLRFRLKNGLELTESIERTVR